MKKPTSWSKIDLRRWRMIYAGLDLHKGFSVVTVSITKRKEMVGQRKITNNGEIVEFLEGLGEPVTVAIEATRGWYWLYDLLEEHGMEVKLSHPLKTKAIASAKIKNDKIDSKVLAHLLRSDLFTLVVCASEGCSHAAGAPSLSGQLGKNPNRGKEQDPRHFGQE